MWKTDLEPGPVIAGPSWAEAPAGILPKTREPHEGIRLLSAGRRYKTVGHLCHRYVMKSQSVSCNAV
jgi:hypothetical protein